MNFKELIFTIIIFYVLFKILRPSVRVFHYHRGFDNRNPQQQPKPDGKISIDKMPEPKNGRKKGPDSGDYVDFEEIK